MSGDGYVVGAVWTAAMLAFEFGLGRWHFHFTWQRLFDEFDVRKGVFVANSSVTPPCRRHLTTLPDPPIRIC